MLFLKFGEKHLAQRSSRSSISGHLSLPFNPIPPLLLVVSEVSPSVWLLEIQPPLSPLLMTHPSVTEISILPVFLPTFALVSPQLATGTVDPDVREWSITLRQKRPFASFGKGQVLHLMVVKFQKHICWMYFNIILISFPSVFLHLAASVFQWFSQRVFHLAEGRSILVANISLSISALGTVSISVV